MEEIFVSTFGGGIQGDLDPAVTPSESYLAAHNLTLTSSGGFLSLSNIRGTQEISTLESNFTGNVLGVYVNKYKIGVTEGVECLTIFTAVTGGDFKIWCYDIENNSIYELFSQEFTSEFEAAGVAIDAVNYPEGNLDILYFTDNYNEMRKLRCEIPTPYSANFLTQDQLSLQRRGTIASISDLSVGSGGSLFCGSYQFVIRFYNEDTRSYTKWTIPSSPVIVSRDVSDFPNQGGYGIGSSKKITLTIKAPTYVVGEFSHYQVAVIENLEGTSILNASLQKRESLSGVVSGEYTLYTYEYKDNTKIGDVTIEDIVVDLAAIRSVKTLQVKNNRIFGGNLKYWNREYDNGNPVVSGSISTQTQGLKDDTALSKYKGHFRDEVYRYYISYHDEYFNYSRPKRLDMSGVSGNQTANGDMRYPSRKTMGYTILDSSSNPRSLGLSLTINNHPSWAKGFVILRAKRKKRIKFQTPFVPSSQIDGVEVIGTYPNTVWYLTGDDGRDDKEEPSASPMNPLGTLVPKNFFYPIKKDIIRTTNDDTTTRTQKGECVYDSALSINKSNSVYFVYPPSLYGDNSYVFSRGDKYETVDYAFLRMVYQDFGVGTNEWETLAGNYVQTSIHGSFYATAAGDYYYSNTTNRPDPSGPLQSGDLVDFKELDGLGEGTNILNSPVGQYSNLETTGVYYNAIPGNQRSGVVYLKSVKRDTALYGRTVSGPMSSSNGGVVPNSLYETTSGEQSNTFSSSKPDGVQSAYASIVDITNIVNDLGDDRYGDEDTIHDVVFTGTSHTFSASEITQIQIDGQAAINVVVFGGDCFVNLQQVKITDSHYGLMNVEKKGAGSQLSANELLRRWINGFENKYQGIGGSNDGRGLMSMPVPLKNVSQVLSVMVESEVLSSIIDPYPYGDSHLNSNKYVVEESTSDSKLRIPFSYGYNINYSKQSDQKAFIPFSEDEVVNTVFKSRGIFSDVKVYQTDIQGFDVFRTSNTFDLEETYGGITKLALVGDDLYALQEKATVYVPVDANEIATTTGDTLSIRSGDVVSIARYVSRLYGTTHMKSVVSKDSLAIYVDEENQCVVKISGGAFELISEKGVIGEFKDILQNPGDLVGMWDNSQRAYILNTSTNCWVWDDRLGLWVGDYETSRLKDGVYGYKSLWALGLTGTDLTINKMYSGDYNVLFGETVTPRVEFSVNPQFAAAKTFDNVVVYSTDKLSTLDIVSARETGATNQEVTGIVLNKDRREGSYRAQILRDSQNARIRGTRATITVKWRTDNENVVLTQVATKWRPSFRPI